MFLQNIFECQKKNPIEACFSFTFDIILFSFHMHFLKSEYMKSSRKKLFYSPFIQQKSNKERGFEPIFYENWETVK